MKQLHTIQLQILSKLLFSRSLRYSQLKPSKDMENNQFQFHLDALINMGYVNKENTKYTLSAKGKEYANRIDENDNKLKLQAKISVWIACTRIINNKTQFLIGTRLKQPFYGCQGYISGKVQYGEKLSAAVKRELTEESGLKCGSSELVAIKHYRVFRQGTSELLEDKFMFLCLVKEPTGSLKLSREGKLEWIDVIDLEKYVTNPFEDKIAFRQQIDLIRNFDGNVKFIEEDYYSDKF
jgi:ADP-ribose pyrophosphatase YjhB (NUDIX family)